MNSDHLAKEAARLKADPIFNKALDDMRQSALDNLAHAKADDLLAIVAPQQLVAAIDEIRTTLDRYIMAADVQDDAGSFA